VIGSLGLTPAYYYPDSARTNLLLFAGGIKPLAPYR
jgi:hypothetical protein